ncbi:MAG TPA: hypothetical protein VK081_08080 [Planctomycetota bacterium]|nr:hypothetical protein [Planctomycetota bacterium]
MLEVAREQDVVAEQAELPAGLLRGARVGVGDEELDGSISRYGPWR